MFPVSQCKRIDHTIIKPCYSTVVSEGDYEPTKYFRVPFFSDSKASLCVLNDFLPANMTYLLPYERNCKPALSGKTKKSQKH